MPDRSWSLLGHRTVFEHRIMTLRLDRYRLAPRAAEPGTPAHEGSAHGPIDKDYVVIETVDWINVIPLTDAREVVLVRQFRHGVREPTFEIPGGMAEAGEDPAQAGLRELREETGCRARAIVPLGKIWPNPAIQTNTCHLFLAEGVEPVAAPEPDEGERIEIHTVPLTAIPEMIRDGRIRHALVVAAFGLSGLLEGPLSGAAR